MHVTQCSEISFCQEIEPTKVPYGKEFVQGKKNRSKHFDAHLNIKLLPPRVLIAQRVS